MSRKSSRASSANQRTSRHSEVKAKLILEHIDPVMYSGLIVKDKPDLIDYKASLGIEVTEANPQANKGVCKISGWKLVNSWLVNRDSGRQCPTTYFSYPLLLGHPESPSPESVSRRKTSTLATSPHMEYLRHIIYIWRRYKECGEDTPWLNSTIRDSSAPLCRPKSCRLSAI